MGSDPTGIRPRTALGESSQHRLGESGQRRLDNAHVTESVTAVCR
jgi:hypothetical protein